MSKSNPFCVIYLLSLSLFLCTERVDAQQTPAGTSSPNASPSSTPAVFSPQTLADLKRLQQAAADEQAIRQLSQAGAVANQKIVYRYFSHGADSK